MLVIKVNSILGGLVNRPVLKRDDDLTLLAEVGQEGTMQPVTKMMLMLVYSFVTKRIKMIAVSIEVRDCIDCIVDDEMTIVDIVS